MRYLLSALSLMILSTTVAQAGPLNRYPDRALLLELGQRGYSCTQTPVQEQYTVLAITCDPYTNMIVELYDASATKLAETKYFMSSQQRCETEKARILAKTERGKLYQDRVIAFCDPYTNMIKLKIDARSISETEKTFQSSNQRCDSNADAFNNLF